MVGSIRTKLRFLYRAYRYRYRVDPAELRFLGRRLRSGQVAVDAGCHKGAYAYWMRRRVGSAGAVFAFEPQPRQVDYLQRAFAAMKYRNVTLVPMALSDATGPLPLFIPSGTGRTHAASLVANKAEVLTGETIQVDTTTLDALFAGQSRGPGFVKIDVEGHELAVLEGARRTLQQFRPTLLIECEARHRPDGDVRPVFVVLASLGYQGSFFHNGRLRPLAEFNPAIHQPQLFAGHKPPHGYVNNFAFEHGS
jgi:FkbM family methyltransferase